MKISDRYIELHNNGLTTRYLSRKYEKDPRTIRRIIAKEVNREPWAEECRRFIARKVEGVTYKEFWSDEENDD